MILAATMSFFASCKDDDGYNDADADRLPMPMFRTTPNTASSTTPYYCDIASRVDPNISLYLQQHGYKASTHVNDMVAANIIENINNFFISFMILSH